MKMPQFAATKNNTLLRTLRATSKGFFVEPENVCKHTSHVVVGRNTNTQVFDDVFSFLLTLLARL